MKKVARLRMPATEESLSVSATSNENAAVRTTGRIKKPKAVFDPSDNYLPRYQRSNTTTSSNITNNSISSERNKRETTPNTSLSGESNQNNKRLSVSSNRSISTTPTSVSEADLCIVCSKPEPKRGANAKNKLIACLECKGKVHKLCTKLEIENFSECRKKFKCEMCRYCALCESETRVELLTCCKCYKSFHPFCHIPNVLKYQQLQKNWKCYQCAPPLASSNGKSLPENEIREIIGDDPKINKIQKVAQYSANVDTSITDAEADDVDSKSLTVKRKLIPITNKSEVHPANGVVDEENDNDIDNVLKKIKTDEYPVVANNDTSSTDTYTSCSPLEPCVLPVVKHWTVDQVTEYFYKYFPKEAHVFKDQEIDGMSLLLLKRSDVVKKLPIKLGPSLRIYSLILKIQAQVNDPTLGWNCEK